MNIFFLHLNVHICAKYYLDKHIVKIILEITQMLYTAHWMSDSPDFPDHSETIESPPYRKTHFNHPTSKWIRQTPPNYTYACSLALALCREYSLRYKKVHKCQARILWLASHFPSSFCSDPIPAHLAHKNVPPGCSPIPLAMPVQFHSNDVLRSYRQYYLEAKQHIVSSPTDFIRFKHLQTDSTVKAQVVPKSKICSRSSVVIQAVIV